MLGVPIECVTPGENPISFTGKIAMRLSVGFDLGVRYLAFTSTLSRNK